jgi:hypothetical protein
MVLCFIKLVTNEKNDNPDALDFTSGVITTYK